MSQKIINIGVDNGNSNTKTASNVFTSGVVSHSEKPPMTKEFIEFEGVYYTRKTSRAVYRHDKTESIDTFILTLFGIAMELEDRGITDSHVSINLAVGLPPGHWLMLQKKFRNYFLSKGKNITFGYKERYYNIHLNRVDVFPQGISAILTQATLVEKYPQIYMIDIGGYTVDYALIQNGQTDFNMCQSLEEGMIVINNKIIQEVSSKYSMKIEDSHIEQVLFNKPTVLPEEIKQFIRDSSNKHALNIIAKLRELGIDLKTNPAVFIGGGAMVMKNALKNTNEIAEAEFIDDISSNARGYQILSSMR